MVKKLTTNPFKKVAGRKYPEMRKDVKFYGYKYGGKIYKTKVGLNIAMKKGKARVATPVYQVK